jgi:hypothetical protein
MLKCPVCSADLAKLDVFPEACPDCGYRLTRSGAESASVQLISDSGEPRNADLDATLQSEELLPSASASADATDDPSNSKTFVSDEWDDAPAPRKNESGQSDRPPIGQSASLQLISDSGEPRQAELETNGTAPAESSERCCRKACRRTPSRRCRPTGRGPSRAKPLPA